MARNRLVWAVGGSLLLHAAGFSVLSHAPGPEIRSAPAQAPAMLWVTVAPLSPSPTEAAPTRMAAAPGETHAARSSPAVAKGAVKPTTVRQQQGESTPRFVASPEPASPEISPVTAAAQAPRPRASEAHPQTALGPDAVARVLERERAWQRQQGIARTPQSWGEKAPAAMGSGVVAHTLRGPGGALTTRVTGPWGEYCVEAPSANQPPAMGAAPRIAPTRTCR